MHTGTYKLTLHRLKHPLWFTFVLLALLDLGTSSSSASADQPPNVVLIILDDLGSSDLGVYGQQQRAAQGLPHIKTPHLDQLAADGMRFTQAYSASPVCAPTRCSLLTGRDQGHAIVRSNWEGGGEKGDVWAKGGWEGQFPLPSGTQTIASLLKPGGYATGGFGKWGLGTPLDGGHPLDVGFDAWMGYLCQRQAHQYYPTHLWRGRQRVELDNPWIARNQKLAEGVDPQDPASYTQYFGNVYSQDVIIEDVKQFITNNASGRFFCYLPLTTPHLALQVPEDEPSLSEYRQMFGEKDRPYVGGRGYLPNRTPRATYAAMITRTDRQIGEILKLLDDLQLTENTLVLFTSDNGGAANGGADLEFFASNGTLRGKKGDVWEGGLRVPVIARWPSQIQPGTQTDLVVVSQDFLPTIAAATGHSPQGPLEGVSFLPTLLGQPDQQVPKYRYWELQRQQALRVGNFKAVRFWGNNRQKPVGLELYDLTTDPSESQNLANDADQAERVAEFTLLLDQAHTPPLIPQWALGKEAQTISAAKNYHPLRSWE